jgi:hypothetical protein
MKPRIAFVAVLAAIVIASIVFIAKRSSSGSAPDGDFQAISTNLSPGWQLYTVEGRKPVGLVKTIEQDHVFLDGKTREGVLILFTDASENWIPRDEVAKLYVAKP